MSAVSSASRAPRPQTISDRCLETDEAKPHDTPAGSADLDGVAIIRGERDKLREQWKGDLEGGVHDNRVGSRERDSRFSWESDG
ncbi:hypothetical protein NITHO_770004 [Nitrolancea hollandica Lb]|uniref:Uncharacterized protein n=1 Tax=Nitrolancea hollandica Lb TaxID=1129897 RepID=I4EN84_9BACT|nr:hypothetical protein NITHO_770004 [Nitrolancea hollandica Lb]